MQHNLQYILILIQFGQMIEFKTKKKRNTAVTVRLSEDTAGKLKKIAEAYERSQADVIETLIEDAFTEYVSKGGTKKKN